MAPTLEHTYATAFGELAFAAEPDIPAGSKVTWVNEPLARELGLDADFLKTPAGLQWLTGQAGPESNTYALAYSGFQFGQLSPVLGDGRAHLVGELAGKDLHLKGSGTTMFSRPGSDGKAPLSAVWREAVIGESLHALGLPTSRALAVIETGETVRRRSPLPEPAGILVRVAASHIRVGTFQFAAMQCEPKTRSDLVEYALNRHYPEVKNAENPALEFLQAVVKSQAELVAAWSGLGFVHGVLNTDNVAISGEAIDFGPCAFIDAFSRDAVYSSIDRQGRYRFKNQPAVTRWNLTRFAEVLLDLIDEDPNRAIDRATFVLEGFEDFYQDAAARVFARKFGLDVQGAPADILAEVYALVEKTFDLLEVDSLDFTGFFRVLAENEEGIELPEALGQMSSHSGLLKEWWAELLRLRAETGTSEQAARELMEQANPVYIPRNLALDAALRAVEAGDQEPLERLLSAIREPYKHKPGCEDLESAPEQSRFFRSFCGT
ncbi:protein adenylyltransferase SelO [Rothia aerolata]|uniref:Protein nucleotidyltransferase YdiU n=1 Tax=Rothia aerolata TaxID=1812262 RepID=A0A917IXD9_9MICC|nr:protein adenylyltransferase SelO family protein [Rothia aerolata]GGH66915.1 hypothetical protein GCM10007359_21530 [Rothia aerolata]